MAEIDVRTQSTTAQAEVALLDRAGVIIWVNRAWREFSAANGGAPDAAVGCSYLAACAADPQDRGAQQVAAAIRAALAGELPAPARVRIACDSPDEARWFDVLTASRLDDRGRCVGAVVTLARADDVEPAAASPLTEPSRRRWTDASNELTQHLLAGTQEAPLDVVLQYAMAGADADMAFISTPLGGEQGWVRAATGAMAHLRHQVVGLRGTLCGEVIRSRRAVLIDTTTDVTPSCVSDLPAGVVAAMGVPLHVADDPAVGSLSVARRGSGPAYDDVDRELLSGFAACAGLVLRLDRARTERERLRQMADRDRIAADLHERVIQQLFATGMGMQGMLDDLAGAPRLRERLLGYVDDLDETIGQIRATVFPQQPPP